MFIQYIRPFSEIIIVALGAMIVILLFWNIVIQISLRKFKKRNEELFSGQNAKSLERIILDHSKNLKTLDKDIQELYNISNQINLLASKGIHKTGLIRFNPFNDIGGDQSFSMALLNGKDNGIVITSLYSREGTRIYAKSVKGGISEKYPLTNEEEQAIKIARIGGTKKIN